MFSYNSKITILIRIYTPLFEQNATDFTKCVAIISERLRDVTETLEKVHYVVAMVGSSQRFDHCMSNLNTLFVAHDSLPSSKVKLYLLSEDCCTFVMGEGLTRCVGSVEEGATCTLMGLDGPGVRVSTVGLKVDAEDLALSCGGSGSSGLSNLIGSDGEWSTVVEGGRVVCVLGLRQKA